MSPLEKLAEAALEVSKSEDAALAQLGRRVLWRVQEFMKASAPVADAGEKPAESESVPAEPVEFEPEEAPRRRGRRR